LENLDQLESLAGMSLEERVRLGQESQFRFRQAHEDFKRNFPAARPEVFFFSPSPPLRTGGQVYNAQMVGELQNHQVTVHCIDLCEVRKLVGADSVVGSVPFSVAMIALLSWRPALLVLDQVYAHILAPALALRSVLRRGKTVVLVHHLDGFDSARSGWLSRWRHRAQLLPADLVITVSRYCKREIMALGVPESKVRIISGSARNSRAGARNGRVGQPVRLLFVGACIERKGLNALIQALARPGSETFRLHLVGDNENGYYRHELSPLIEELHLGSRVVAEGRVTAERLEECFREADAFVFPSFQEGYGLAMLEAMLAGLPVLCSRTSALPELVEEGRSGYLFEPGNPEDIARALQLVLDDPEALGRMGQAARARALEEPSWEESRARFYGAIEPLL
jgi:glycosyltransferase involved in cell wall biosynthesis